MKILSLILLAFVTTLQAQNPPIIDLELFASGFDGPVEIKNAGDDRLFIVEQSGLIRILNTDGSINDEPFLDLTNVINDAGFEEGLLGLAFHPDYATNGLFYVNYIETISGSDNTVISSFTVSDDANIADPDSQSTILMVSQPFSNHNGGSLQFGTDGFLYIALGDGGSGGDPGNRSQNLNLLLGKLLRIDIDNPNAGLNYGIPADNPFVNDNAARDEIWAYGLRNPWKFSFDSENDDLWIADVGQNEIEEINRVSTASIGGENYGWRCFEGSEPFNTSGCPDNNTLTFPVAEYTHSGNGIFKCSITGGYVYRGTEFPNMVGTYLFGDFCSAEMATLNEDNEITYFGPFDGGIASLGVDLAGEMYVAIPDAGAIYNIIDTSVLSIDDNAFSSASLFPNPAKNQVNFEYPAFTKAEQLNIYDLTGKLVQSEPIKSSSTNFSITSLSSGVYIARMTGTNQTLKLVVR